MNDKTLELAGKYLRGELTEVQLGYWKQTLKISAEEWDAALAAHQQAPSCKNLFGAFIFLSVFIFLLIWIFN